MVKLFLALLPLLGGSCAQNSPSLWEGPIQLPLVAAAAANLPDGKILAWSAYSRFNWGGSNGYTHTAIYDPISGATTTALVENTDHDMFCPGTAMLGDGRIMVTGGANNHAVSIYNPADNSWSKGYHSMTPLADGSVFTLGGSFQGGPGSKDGEVWNPTTNAWTVKPGIAVDSFEAFGGTFGDNHMWLITAPNGKIYHAGPSAKTHWIDVTTGTYTNSVTRPGGVMMTGNAVLYDIGKVFAVGGSGAYSGAAGKNSAFVYDLNDGDNVSVTQTSSMTFPRAWCNSVVLPSGEVVVLGGMEISVLFSNAYPVFTAEIWNPSTGQFAQLSRASIERNYHSVALLLKDGRVLSSGGGLCGNGCAANHPDVEILTPPYLLNTDGSAATRPVIVSCPATFRPGVEFTVNLNANEPHTFAAVRTGAVTHSTNNDQRRVPLSVVSVSGSAFIIKAPSNAAILLPGDYFLFAMNENGVPSVAETISFFVDGQPSPTDAPTTEPTSEPTPIPTVKPTLGPTLHPTEKPSLDPTAYPSTPSAAAVTTTPTLVVQPTQAPKEGQSETTPSKTMPESSPMDIPSTGPTSEPTLLPTEKQTMDPTLHPTDPPTFTPTVYPTAIPHPTTSPEQRTAGRPEIVDTAHPTTTPPAQNAPKTKAEICLEQYTESQCVAHGYRNRKLQRIETDDLMLHHEGCLSEPYQMFLVVEGVHFAGLAVAVDGGLDCPSIVLHSQGGKHGVPVEKVAMIAADEEVESFEESSKHYLGQRPLGTILNSFTTSDTGRNGAKLYDAITNNCVALLRNMADPLNIPVDEGMINFITKQLLEASDTHLWDGIQRSPALNLLVRQGKRMLKGINKEALVRKLVEMYI